MRLFSLRQREHALDGLYGLSGDGGVYLYAGPTLLQRMIDLGERVLLHVRTLVA